MEHQELSRLLTELLSYSGETEWIEFKLNNDDPQEIGEYLSALSNAAALHRKEASYIVWGIKSGTHEIIGTAFKPRQKKKGNEELENWLLRLLSPRIDIRIYEFQENNKDIVILEIQTTQHTPVSFSGTEYIRVGTLKKKLKDYPEKERALWTIFSEKPFDKGTAANSISSDEVLQLIDYPACFELLKHPLPDNRNGILERLTQEKVIIDRENGRYDVTNLGGILFAKDLSKFDRLFRKALRIIVYKGNNRVETIKEQTGNKGYAIGFESALDYINDQLPHNEEIGQALRKEVCMYPKIAVRELVANALIHQDFTITGTGPMVEIFEDRMEITNPGIPLIDTLRFIDEPPRSRNEGLASIMRRMSICEERGSGIDKIIFQVELFQLPAPDFRISGNGTISVLYGPRRLEQMDRKERVRACYQHACLQFVSGQRMSNASLRKRMGIKESSYTIATKIINDTISAKLMRLHSGSRRDANYVPFWA